MEMSHHRRQRLLSTWVGCIIERVKGSLSNRSGVSWGREIAWIKLE
jgi:hypothetical protein